MEAAAIVSKIIGCYLLKYLQMSLQKGGDRWRQELIVGKFHLATTCLPGEDNKVINDKDEF